MDYILELRIFLRKKSHYCVGTMYYYGHFGYGSSSRFLIIFLKH
jgi:hypothetical protein